MTILTETSFTSEPSELTRMIEETNILFNMPSNQTIVDDFAWYTSEFAAKVEANTATILDQIRSFEEKVAVPSIQALIYYKLAPVNVKYEISKTLRSRKILSHYHAAKRIVKRMQEGYIAKHELEFANLGLRFRKLISSVELAMQFVASAELGPNFDHCPTQSELKSYLAGLDIAGMAEQYRATRVELNQAALKEKTVDDWLINLTVKERLAKYNGLDRYPGMVLIVGEDKELYRFLSEDSRVPLQYLCKLAGKDNWRKDKKRGGKPRGKATLPKLT